MDVHPRRAAVYPATSGSGLWRWLLRFARRCNPRDWQASAQARAALLHDARQRFDAWVARYGLECEFRNDGLDYVFGDARRFAQYRDECALLAQWGIRAEVIDGADYIRQNPAFRDGIAGAIHFPGDAHLRPEQYTAELARVLRARCVVIDAHCRVQAIVPDGAGSCVQTEHGKRPAREVVIATGPWSPVLAAQLGLRLPVQAGKGYSTTYSAPHLMPRRPVVLKDRWVFVVPWRDRLRIGSTMEFSGRDTQLNATRLAALERAAAEYLQAPCGPAVIERWYGWRPMTWDDVPVLGAVPGHPHVWLAAGHGMLGISMSTASGQLMADLITGRAPALDPHPYRAERFA